MELMKTRICLALLLSCTACSSCGPSAKEAAASEAMKGYQEYLKNEDLHALTATAEYPRGDSHAVYAFGDCDGDGLPELHISGGKAYRVYTYRDGKVAPMYSFESSKFPWYPYIVGLKDGAFAGCGIYERTLPDYPDGYNSEHRIPSEDIRYPTTEPETSSHEYYFYYRMDGQGTPIDSESHDFRMEYINRRNADDIVYRADGEICGKEEWEERSAPYRDMLTDPSLQLPWEPLFPKDEWGYLDAMEEGNGVPQPECGPEEWSFYERILSGDFSPIRDLGRRAQLTSRYRRSLDAESGRSHWKYILLDFSGDGVKDLFIRYEPDESDYTSADFFYGSEGGVAYFSYQEENPDWWDFDISHEAYIPLNNGQMMLWSSYGATTWLTVGKMLPWRNLLPEKSYYKLSVNYDIYDKEYYEGFDVDQEGNYYSFEHFDSQGEYESSGNLTEEEWRQAEARLEELLIPNGQWRPASVFMPNRYPEEFSQG